MSDWRRALDDRVARAARIVVRHRRITIASALLPILLLASQLPRVTIDTSTEGFLHEDDPAMVDYDAFRDRFGRDELVVLALAPARVFDAGFLETLRALHLRLEQEVPHLDEVTSLINARATRGAEGELIVEDLLETWPESEAELRALERYATGNPSYRNLLLSQDARLTTVLIKTDSRSSLGRESLADLEAGFGEESHKPDASERAYLTPEEDAEVVRAVQAIVKDFASPDLPILMAGSPVVMHELKASMQHDMLRFIRLTLLAIALFLFLLFRRLSAVLLPLVVIVLSLIATIGLMTLTGRPLKLPTMILPSFLLAVAVGDSVHILALFFRDFDAGMDKEEAIVGALEHSGLPVILTSLTTAGGLLSFAPTALAPVADLGIFAPIGVLIALLLSLLLLPALLAATPLRPLRAAASTSPGPRRRPLDALLEMAGDVASGRPWTVIGVTAILLCIAAIGTSRVVLSHRPVGWLPTSSPTRVATETIDRELRGSVTAEVMLDAGRENAWYEPELLAGLDAAARAAEQYERGSVFVGRAFSLADVSKEINRALNENDPAYYVVPDDRELVAQEFLLFENSGSDDLEDFVDSQFSLVRLTLKVPFVDAVAYADALDVLEQRIRAALGPDVKITLTGLMPLLFRTFNALIESLISSYLIAFVVITLLMILLIGSLRLGLVAMLPNLLPILVALAIMGFFGLPLDAFTLLIGSIALGLAVDDTIHFMHNYRRYLHETGSSRKAIQLTLDTAGRAMLFTTLVLSSGFFLFTLSSMTNIRNFGLLTGIALIVALLADFLLAPALMQVIHGPKSDAGASRQRAGGVR